MSRNASQGTGTNNLIVSFVQTKGGTGKSTLALNIAFSNQIQRQFSSVALVELDPQGTLKNWWTQREEESRSMGNISFHHLSSTQKEVIQEGIKAIALHNQLLILDIPGESTGKIHTKFASVYSDLVVIPMRISTNDETAFADNMLPIIKEIIKSNPEKKGTYQILPSFTHAQANKKKILDYFKDILPEYIGCLDSLYPFRSLYENFNREGMCLSEYVEQVKSNKKLNQQASKALDDIENIAAIIIQKLEHNTQ